MQNIEITKHHIKIAVTFLMFQYLGDVKVVTKSKGTKNRIDKLIQNLWDMQRGINNDQKGTK